MSNILKNHEINICVGFQLAISQQQLVVSFYIIMSQKQGFTLFIVRVKSIFSSLTDLKVNVFLLKIPLH